MDASGVGSITTSVIFMLPFLSVEPLTIFMVLLPIFMATRLLFASFLAILYVHSLLSFYS